MKTTTERDRLFAKTLANLILGPMSEYCNKNKIPFDELPLMPGQGAEVVELIIDNKISFSNAKILLNILYEQNLARTTKN